MALDLTGDYVYDPAAGEGITVYVIDSGMNTKLPEFANLGEVRWLWPPEKYLRTNGLSKTEDDQKGHGTCVVSKIAGRDYGIAKKVQIVVCKLYYNSKGQPRESSVLNCLQYILEDLDDKELQGKAVLNFAYGGEFQKESPTNSQETPTINKRKRIRSAMQNFIDEDIVVVLSSGNDKVSCPFNRSKPLQRIVIIMNRRKVLILMHTLNCWQRRHH